MKLPVFVTDLFHHQCGVSPDQEEASSILPVVDSPPSFDSYLSLGSSSWACGSNGKEIERRSNGQSSGWIIWTLEADRWHARMNLGRGTATASVHGSALHGHGCGQEQ
jgi:hypothetical protein